MLDLQKIEAGKMQINYVCGDVVSFPRYLYESFEQTAGEKELVLEFVSVEPEIWMDYDEEKLTQIVVNLLANAIRHTSPGGKVSLHLDRGDQPDALVLEVRDNGVGISKDELPFIFDRFYQSSRAAQGGTGIGLSLAKNLVELLKGKITVESQPGQGTVFRLTLPISEKGPKANQQLKSGNTFLFPSLDDEARFADPAGINSDSPVILITEDHPQVLKFICACLAKDFTIVTAKDGEEGIQKAFEIIPDLIISDIMMPGKNGFELCAAIKNNILTSHIPVILLTGRGDQAALMEGIAHGADAYVVKPFEPAELNLRITKLLELRDSLSEHYKKIASSENGALAPTISIVENEFILKIRSFIEEHINDSQFNMNSLTRHMGMSHPQLHRKMIALTGESTGKFVRSVRMSKAIELLKNSDLNVSEIAYEVGFSEPGYFTKVFTKEYNVTPTEFRTNRLNSN